MKIDRKFRIDEMTSPKGERYGLDTVFVDRVGDKPLLVATNGHALVAIKVALDEGDTANWIDPEVFDVIRKSTSARASEADVEVNGKAIISGTKFKGTTIPTPELPIDAFPDWRAVCKSDAKSTVTIAFDPKLLLQIVAAMGSPRYVVLELPVSASGKSTLDPIRVRPSTEHEAAVVEVALMMPVRLE